MITNQISIGELADKSGLTRRAVRFYVQREMIPPPEGKGRGSHYGTKHLECLKKIQELQEAGHSLESIRQIMEGKEDATIPASARGRRPGFNAELWTRIRVMEGVELHLDTNRHRASTQQLDDLRQALIDTFNQ